MKIAGFQMDTVWEKQEENFSKVKNAAEAAAKEGALVLALPEMFSTGFTMDSEKFAEEKETSKTLKFLKETACENNLWIIGSLIDKTDAGNMNSAYTITPKGEIIGHYSKIHLFPLSGEDKHYAKGRDIEISNIEGIPLAVTICYDLRFPELYRKIMGKGAMTAFVVANWPKTRREHWLALLRARAIENQMYVIGINRVGEGGGQAYSGDSIVFGPAGEEIAKAKSGEGLFFFEIEEKKVREDRKHYPFLKDIQKDMFSCIS